MVVNETGRIRCRSVLVGLLVLVGTACSARVSSAEASWGVAGGYPHIVSLVVEIPAQGVGRLQLSASPLIVINSMTARVMAVPLTTRLRPYGWLGAGIINSNEGDSGGPVGTTGFFWGGIGAKYSFRRVDVFGELGGMSGMDESKGYDATSVSGAVGLLIVPASK